jgi:hypothetical protein
VEQKRESRAHVGIVVHHTGIDGVGDATWLRAMLVGILPGGAQALRYRGEFEHEVPPRHALRSTQISP